ncbi:DUF6585 family protein [Streptomyces sp. NPDC047737]|uniref:DUF6585 family protein n=1 Tax=unclassified Streptomyces TaxID=2593676 RepID=UPI003400B298
MPTEPVTALAEERGLGAWGRATYLPKKGVFLRKWEGSRLYFFDNGLVVTGPEGYRAAYDWETASVLQSISTINGTAVADARYTLFDRSGAAVGIGRGLDMVLPGRREELGITSLVKGAPFTFEGDWGPYIQERIARAQMTRVLERFARGETVRFGAVALSGAGVSVKARSAAWTDLTRIGPSNGHITFPGAHRRGQALPSVLVPHVANLHLFCAICRRMGCT